MDTHGAGRVCSCYVKSNMIVGYRLRIRVFCRLRKSPNRLVGTREVGVKRMSRDPIDRTRVEACGRLLAAALVVLSVSPAAAECTWFSGADRAVSAPLAAPKEAGVRSVWGFTDSDEAVWDFSLGTDASICRMGSDDAFWDASARFGVFSRFQFNSASFNMWGVDLRGGLVVGRKWSDRYAGELFIYHESSHLGDEVMEEETRQRIDANLNGIRLMGRRNWECGASAYAGVSVQQLSTPEDIEGICLHLGGEATGLPPWKRGFAALDSQWWGWRDWSPDVCFQVGCTLGRLEGATPQPASRVYIQVYSGRVQVWQYWDETETSISLGIAHKW